MYLESLALEGVRNLQPVQLSFNPELNLIYGENGGGKTSLLEAIWLLGRGRSFRTRHLPSIIQHTSSQCTVSGMVVREGGSRTQLGISREQGGDFQFRVNRMPARSSSELAEKLPLLLINAESFQLVEGGPGYRRRYLDWLVFHVEHQSRPVWKEFNQVLKQRNSLLRRGKISSQEIAYWDDKFIALSEQVNHFRERLLASLFEAIQASLSLMEGVSGLSLEFDRGWNDDQSLSMLLREMFIKEQSRGTSLLGPHRADIRLRLKGRQAREILSRGQAKILACAMQAAQIELFRNKTGDNPVVLIDDLPAELDIRHRQNLLNTVLGGGAQLFATGVEVKDLLGGLSTTQKSTSRAMFHVEHGEINANGKT